MARNEIRRERISSDLQGIIDWLNKWAEIANTGIVIQAAKPILKDIIPHVIFRIIPAIVTTIVMSVLNFIILISDPMIYVFRALARLTRRYGNKILCHILDIEHVEDDDWVADKHLEFGPHKHQTFYDITITTLFVLAVIAFIVALFAPQVLFVAWVLGLAGVSFLYQADHKHLHIQMKKALEQDRENALTEGFNKKDRVLQPKDGLSPEERCRTAAQERALYLCVLLGVGMLLLCSTFIVFAPPVIVPILATTSKIGGYLLALINGCRFLNHKKPGIFVGVTKPIIDFFEGEQKQPDRVTDIDNERRCHDIVFENNLLEKEQAKSGSHGYVYSHLLDDDEERKIEVKPASDENKIIPNIKQHTPEEEKRFDLKDGNNSIITSSTDFNLTLAINRSLLAKTILPFVKDNDYFPDPVASRKLVS